MKRGDRGAGAGGASGGDGALGLWLTVVLSVSGMAFLGYVGKLLDERSLMIKVNPRQAMQAVRACKLAVILYLLLLVYSLFRLRRVASPADRSPARSPFRGGGRARRRPSHTQTTQALLQSQVDPPRARPDARGVPRGLVRKRGAASSDMRDMRDTRAFK